ncbi:hypothetical protein SK128_013710, partial [Halocaridina rubra]
VQMFRTGACTPQFTEQLVHPLLCPCKGPKLPSASFHDEKVKNFLDVISEI